MWGRRVLRDLLKPFRGGCDPRSLCFPLFYYFKSYFRSDISIILGNLFWHEQGFRFGWRVMVMEKAGYAQFIVKDISSQEEWFVQNSDHLTPFQEKQMSFQPDFILEYAHYLKEFYERSKGHNGLEVYVDSYVALNGSSSRAICKVRCRSDENATWMAAQGLDS